MKGSVRKARFRFGAYLRSLRESRKMSREELATLSGLNKGLIRGFEMGTAWYEMPLVTKFVEALGINFSTVAKQINVHFRAISIPVPSTARKFKRGPVVRVALAC